MELQKFISQSLVEIMGGLKEAQEALKGKSHGRVCPTFHSYVNDRPHVVGEARGGRVITLVEFDVAVEAASETSAGGGIKVLGGLISGDAAAKGKDTDKMASRIKFSVPIIYPDVDEQ